MVLPAVSYSQINTGGILGRVTDPSGAVVANAKVTLANLGTGVEVEGSVTPTGDYAFRGLAPGMYKLTVTAPGFTTFEETNIPVTVATTANRDVQLTLGATTTAVTVTASAVALQTASAQLGTTVGEREVRDLPLNGRNFTQLLVMTAGAASPGTTGIWGNPQAGDYRQPSINGQDTNSTGFVLDGTNNRSNFSGGISVAPIVDDIEEFKVVSHSDSVEYTGYLGGYVNVVTKSGTNNYHGAAWEFLRNDKLDARNPFLPNVNPLKQNQFGGNFGGPIIHNRLFAFGSYQGFRQRIGSTSYYAVPTPAQIAGDFTYKVDGVTPELPIYNIYSTRVDPNDPTNHIRDRFMCDAGGAPIAPNADGTQTGGTACNKVPTALLNPFALHYATLFPAPVSTPVPLTNGLDTAPQKQSQDFWNVRGDYQISSSQQISGRYSHINSPNTTSGGIIGSSFLRDSFGYNIAANYSYTITPSTVFHANFGHTWINLHLSSVWDKLDYDSFVFPVWPWACNLSTGFGSHNCWAPLQNIPGYAQVNNFNTHVGQTNIWEGTPTLDHIHGNHFIKVGGTFARHRIWAVTQRMFANYSNVQTADLNNLGNTGASVASFMLGLPYGGEMADTYPGTQQPSWTWGGFAQDQWKISSKLTLNYGLRWDLFNPGQYGTKGTTNYYSGRMDVLRGIYWIPANPGSCAQKGAAPCIPTPDGSLPAHVEIAPNHKISQVVWDNWAPRIGLAYRLRGNTVLRAGIGRYYDTWGNVDVLIVQSEGLWPDSKAVAAANRNSIYFDGTTTENPLGIVIGAGKQPDPNGPFNLVRNWLDPAYKNPYVDQWNVGIEQQFGPSTMLEVNYVGSRGRRTVWNNFLGQAPTPGPGDPTLRQPFSYIPPAQVYTDWGRNWYNALQLTMKRRAVRGLSYQLVYTWSKNEDLNGGQDDYHLMNEKGISGNNLAHVLAFGWTYEMPFGKGKKFSSSSRAANAIIGGWQLNGLLQVTSGLPYGMYYCGDTANVGRTDCYMRPNMVGNPKVSNPTISRWFDPSAFAVAANYTFGNSPRNFLQTDGLFNLDSSIFRNFAITEKTSLQFRFEAFNITNTPTWGYPNTNIQSGSAGVIGGTRSTERQLQFALKLYF
ncbi:MAG: TonB-dependent receptor [Acidobacteriia bacterium]|nr:TonB-dependent receptor [Terriglobia bacterium]